MSRGLESIAFTCRLIIALRNACLVYLNLLPQAHLKPNHARAAELRLIKKGEQGWLKQVWPNLAIIRVALSGPYSMPLPKVTIKIPNVDYIITLLITIGVNSFAITSDRL